VDGVNVGRQQTFTVVGPGGQPKEMSVQISRDIRGAHKDIPQVEAGEVKSSGQTDAAGRPRLVGDTKVRVNFDPHPPQCGNVGQPQCK
jgi:hypothetical protein